MSVEKVTISKSLFDKLLGLTHITPPTIVVNARDEHPARAVLTIEEYNELDALDKLSSTARGHGS